MNSTVDGNLEKLTSAVLASYRSDPRTERIDHAFLPSRERIVGILQSIRQLLFPGYFGPEGLTGRNVRFHAGNLLAGLGESLADEIGHCLCMSRPRQRTCGSCPDAGSCRRHAERLAKNFLARVPLVRRMLALDAQAAYDGDPAAEGIEEIIYCYPGFQAVTTYRVAHELRALGVPLMPRIMTEYAHGRTGADIHPGARIGKAFFIDHATGVVIGETTVIGERVKIYQGVTLGALSFPRDQRGRIIRGAKRHPTIEDDVVIYANATILGGQTVIGRGVTVGANTFVTESISAGAKVTQENPKLRVHHRKTAKRS